MIKDRKWLILILSIIVIFLYRYSPRRIEFLGHYNKVFAHRVNSLEKLKVALNYFDGVELDLVYDKTNNSIEVNHPPAKSIGLYLDTYLSEIPEDEFPFLWLDIKALDATNANAILLKLNTLFERKNYPKQQILIETLQPEALPIFTKAGYKTSYYLPIGLGDMNKKTLDKDLKIIKNVLLEQPEIGISTSYKNYPIVTAHFPNKTKYIWALTSSYKPEFKTVRSILEDETVLIVLSSFQSFKGNR